jgi:hypothetical protein
MGAIALSFVITAYLPQDLAARAIATALTAEAVLWFFVPFLSYPRAARLDTGAIVFLQQNVGYNRVVGFEGRGIAPNYGAALGIPSLSHGDPGAEDPAVFRAKLPVYAKAGVKYILADANFNIRNPANISSGLPAHDLAVGEVVEAAFIAADPTLAGLTVIVNTRARDAVGRLKTTACAVNRCVSAEAPVETAQSGRPLLFAFPDMLPVSAHRCCAPRSKR